MRKKKSTMYNCLEIKGCFLIWSPTRTHSYYTITKNLFVLSRTTYFNNLKD